MANLKRYIFNGLRDGSPVDLYFLRVNVGNGKIHKFDTLNIKMEAKGEVFGIVFDASVEIIMPDESPRGECLFGLQGQKPETVHYYDEAGKLRLNKNDLHIYTEGSWTWVWVELDRIKKGWIGVWPAGATMSEEDKNMTPPMEPENL